MGGDEYYETGQKSFSVFQATVSADLSKPDKAGVCIICFILCCILRGFTLDESF